MAERMTWEEIVARYPDEWVILTDFDEDRTDGFIVAAVADHGKNRDAMEERMARMRIPTAFFFTGLMSDLPLVLSS